MFDSLIWRCPFCSSANEAQTKAGPSCMDEYEMSGDLPIWLMDDLNGEIEQCFNCRKKLKLVFDLEVKLKKKIVEPTTNLDWVELKYKQRQALKDLNKSAKIKKEKK